MNAPAVDLHTHTTCSDGMLTPAELVGKAHSKGIKVLAITDHDSIDGVAPATEAAEAHEIAIVPGVELSIQFLGRELHLLGFFFDIESAELRAFIDHYRLEREHRARRIIGKLNALGLKIDFDYVLDHVKGSVVGRPHIASALVAKGYAATFPEAFIKYIGNKGPANVEKSLPHALDAIDVLHQAGGIAVLAHPGHWVSDRDVLRLQELGLDGVEIIHPSHDEVLTDFYKEVAYRQSLVMTGGSDYHGMRAGDERNFGAIGLTIDEFAALQQQTGKLCHNS